MTSTATPHTQPTQQQHVAVGQQPAQCARHGPYEATLWGRDPEPVSASGRPLPAFLRLFLGACPQCDAERQREADIADAEIRGGMSERERIAALRRRALGIPLRFAESTVDNWLAGMDAQRAIVAEVRDWIRSFDLNLANGRNLVFCGPPGTGKTHLAAGVLRGLSDRGGTGLYTTAFDAVAAIRDTYRRDAERTERQVVEAFVAVDLLVVDEVGRQLDTEHERQQFFRLLDARYRELKPVLLVSNMGPKELAAYLGDAIADRLREGGGRVLVFDWASHRSSKRKGAK